MVGNSITISFGRTVTLHLISFTNLSIQCNSSGWGVLYYNSDVTRTVTISLICETERFSSGRTVTRNPSSPRTVTRLLQFSQNCYEHPPRTVYDHPEPLQAERAKGLLSSRTRTVTVRFETQVCYQYLNGAILPAPNPLS